MSSTEGAAPESEGSEVCYDVVSGRHCALRVRLRMDEWMDGIRDETIG